MHITNQYFWHKIKIDNFDPFNVFWAIATNIPQRLKTGFVVQCHLCYIYFYIINKYDSWAQFKIQILRKSITPNFAS